MNDANILVVEDEAIVAANIEMRLQSLGYHVPAIVDTGDEALQMIEATHPDLVLMDIRIRGQLDGIATAEIIQERHAIPVIYLTAYIDDETIRRARQTEPYGYILKPFEVSELHTAIELALYRHMSERQQRAREQWFATTLHSIGDAVVTTDTQGLITYLNPAAESLISRSLADIVGHPFDTALTLIDEATGTALASPILAILADQRPVADAPHQALLLPNGDIVPIEARASLIRDERDILLGAVVVLHDLRERREMENRLRLIEAAVQQTDEMILLFSAGAATPPRIVFVNYSFVRITGYTLEDALGRTPGMLYGHGTNPALIEQLDRAFQHGWPVHGEGLVYCRDGHSFQAEWNLTPLRDSRGQITHWVAVLRDVTRRRREQEVRWQRQKLESLGALAGGIAHDFNNLLAVVLGNASMALLELPTDSAIRDLIVPIESAARRAATLTRQMLAYAGHDRLSAQPLDVNALIRETCASLAASLTPGVEIQTRLDSNLPHAFADIAQIRRVVRNLIVNANEAIGEGPGNILVSTSLTRLTRDYIASTYLAPNLPPGDYLSVTVQDNGAGMDTDVLARLFEPFFTTKFAGRGLGMAEVLGIISAHQGTIKVESSIGRGSSFTIALPIAAHGIEDDGELYESPRTPGLPGTSRGLLLLLESDPSIAAQIAQTLERAGYAVLKAPDAAAAQEIYAAYSATIRGVLIDAGLPDDQARHTLAEIRSIRSDACAILLSTHDGSIPPALVSDQSAVIRRPCSPDELRDAVLRAVG